VNNIFGVDLDAQAVEVAQLSLYLKLLEEETAATVQPKLGGLREQLLPSLTKNIVHGNSLIDYDIMDMPLFSSPPAGGGVAAASADGVVGDRELRKLNPMNFASTFPQVFANGGFDAIVGNPPYIRIQTMQETSPVSVEHFKKKYLAASKGNYDIYVVFVEKALSLLSEQGKLGYILPHKFFNAKYGEALRGLIAKGQNLDHIVHFGDQQIFAGATTYTCLLHLNKRKSSNFDFVKVDDLVRWRDEGYGNSGVIRSDKVFSADWNFSVGDRSELFDKLQLVPVRLADVAERMYQGCITSADGVFLFKEFSASPNPNTVEVFSKELGIKVPIEKGVLKSVIRSGSIHRYTAEPTALILFPYDVENDAARLISEESLSERFPLAYDYLRTNKVMLSAREKGKFDDQQWYRFGRSQNLAMWERPKLMIPYMITELSAYLDVNQNYYFINVTTGGYGVTFKSSLLDNRYFCGLMNSKVLDFFFKCVSSNFHGGYFAANKQFIEQLPIRTIDFTNPTEKAMHDRVVELVEKMIDGKKKLSAARTDADRAFYERFCEKMDHDIDSLVYTLYDISDDERKIIEGN